MPQLPKISGVPVGVYIWLIVLVIFGVGLWFLFDLFPGSLSSESDMVHLVRSISILALISSGLLFKRRINFGEGFRNIAIWIGIAAILVLAYSYQDMFKSVASRIAAELLPGRPVVVSEGIVSLTRGDDGHFHVTGTANGIRLEFLIDTGATGISLSPDDAERLGVDLSTLRYTQIFQTANGMGRGAPWQLDRLAIGLIEFQNVAVSINEAEMSTSLLGMSFLNRLGSFEIKGRKLTLRQQAE
jgi:aspartyl protease family protein